MHKKRRSCIYGTPWKASTRPSKIRPTILQKLRDIKSANTIILLQPTPDRNPPNQITISTATTTSHRPNGRRSHNKAQHSTWSIHSHQVRPRFGDHRTSQQSLPAAGGPEEQHPARRRDANAVENLWVPGKRQENKHSSRFRTGSRFELSGEKTSAIFSPPKICASMQKTLLLYGGCRHTTPLTVLQAWWCAK